MYLLGNAWHEKINTTFEFTYKPGIDLYVHWLNPRFGKRLRRL